MCATAKGKGGDGRSRTPHVVTTAMDTCPVSRSTGCPGRHTSSDSSPRSVGYQRRTDSGSAGESATASLSGPGARSGRRSTSRTVRRMSATATGTIRPSTAPQRRRPLPGAGGVRCGPPAVGVVADPTDAQYGEAARGMGGLGDSGALRLHGGGIAVDGPEALGQGRPAGAEHHLTGRDGLEADLRCGRRAGAREKGGRAASLSRSSACRRTSAVPRTRENHRSSRRAARACCSRACGASRTRGRASRPLSVSLPPWWAYTRVATTTSPSATSFLRPPATPTKNIVSGSGHGRALRGREPTGPSSAGADPCPFRGRKL